jgi:hypothetical protein
VFGQQAGERHQHDEAIIAYRNRWLDALLVDSGIEAVISFGHLGRDAFQRWRETTTAASVDIPFEHLTHPTMPEAASKGDPTKKAEATRKMLAEWNQALTRLDATLGSRDVQRDLVLYGDSLLPDDRAAIPEADMPAGTPPWMRSVKQWAERRAVGEGLTNEQEVEAKRATVVVTVPTAERPWH